MLTDFFAVPEYHRPITQGKNLVQFVRDIDAGDAFVPQASEDFHQAACFFFRQHRGRLIQDQNFGIAVQGPGYGHQLLHGGVKIPDGNLGVDIHAQNIQRLSGLGMDAIPVDQTQWGSGIVAQEDIFSHRQVQFQIQFLVDHGDASFLGVCRALEFTQAVAHHQRTFVAAIGVDATENLHQGRFAGTVFSCQRQDFVGIKFHIHAFQGNRAAEALDHIFNT